MNYNIHYNISHSDKQVTGSTDNLPVGIDVEQIKPIDIKISERFFSKHEFNKLLGKSYTEREPYFYELWTLKESYIKAVEKGLSIPLDSFTIRINGGNITVCSKKNEFPQDINIIDVNELYNKFLLYVSQYEDIQM